MVLCSHVWQEEQHVTFNISTVPGKKKKKSPAAVNLKQALQRRSQQHSPCAFACLDTCRAALSSLLSLGMFYLCVPLLESRTDAAKTNHSSHPLLHPSMWSAPQFLPKHHSHSEVSSIFSSEPSAPQNCGVAKPLTFPGK